MPNSAMTGYDKALENARETDNDKRKKEGSKADTDTAMVANQEEASKRLGGKLKAAGGVEDTPPRMNPGESLPDFAGRQREYRKRKADVQAAALR